MDDGRWRLPVKASEVDPAYIDVLLAFEDKRFREHHGVDPLALGRAAWQFATHGRIVSGGSTITMQVARLIEPRRDRSVAAKLRQIVRAVQLERALSKDEILESLPDARAVRRQPRRRARRRDRLFRQGAEAAVACRSGVARRPAAVAGDAAAGPASGCGPQGARSRADAAGRYRPRAGGRRDPCQGGSRAAPAQGRCRCLRRM